MASTATLPQSKPSMPYPSGGPGASKEAILTDIRRQLDDSDASSQAGSSASSRRRRRARKNKSALTTGLAGSASAVLPRLADTKPVRLQLGLNLDVELELKARLQGDVSLTLL